MAITNQEVTDWQVVHEGVINKRRRGMMIVCLLNVPEAILLVYRAVDGNTMLFPLVGFMNTVRTEGNR